MAAKPRGAIHHDTSSSVRGRPAPVKRNPVQLSTRAKSQMDLVKQSEKVDTYNDVIDILYRMWRKNIGSFAGTAPKMGEFEREGDDSHRTPR